MINPKAFLTFTLLALCLALPVHAKPAPSAVTHTVLETQGKVRLWLPWSSRWRTVKKGQRLQSHSLVVVDDDSKLTYESRKQNGKASVRTVSTPGSLRIGSAKPRRIDINPLFIRPLPELPDHPMTTT